MTFKNINNTLHTMMAHHMTWKVMDFQTQRFQNPWYTCHAHVAVGNDFDQEWIFNILWWMKKI